jgi:heat shock protein HslJ
MRPLALLCATLSLTACMSPAQSEPEIEGVDWHLLGQEGQAVDWKSTIRFDGAKVAGKAPCNHWFANNEATLPRVVLTRIGATRMACPELDKEQALFESLGAMQRAEMDQNHLFLIGPEGRIMEFAKDPREPCLSCLARQ